MKTAFLLLGAQRSGTSVTSHLLSKFGINFGDPTRFLQAEHNPLFFELVWVNQYNDRLIQTLGYTYTDPFLPLEADYNSATIRELEKELPSLIQQEWQDQPMIGIKDPRISLTFPVWQRALLKLEYALKIILVFRHPQGFLRSNQKLFHNWQYWDEERHLHFWLRLTLAALYFTRDYSIFFVNYNDVVDRPLDVADRFATSFNLAKSQINVAATVVEPSCYHYNAVAPTGYALVDYYYDRLCAQTFSEVDYLHYRSNVLGKNK
jgi:hypothetical protein